jgi:coenzyme F420-dependent glucose-6-phosphate dehydrogenase
MEIGFHFSHEQFSPAELLSLVSYVEDAGFTAGSCSDHFYPWSEKQGESGFAWAWLGAALQASSLSFGTVNAPVMRYHPAIIAQAAATLSIMFPGRFWLAVGSGQLLNEGIMGEPWLGKELRNKRLFEAVKIIRALWKGETITHNGLIKVENAKLYSLPETSPLLIAAALTPKTAAWAAGWSDGLITVSKPLDELKEVINAFKNNGGKNKPLYLKVEVSYDPDEETAFEGAWEQWKTNVISSSVQANLRTPAEFDETADAVDPEFFISQIIITSKKDVIIDNLNNFKELGFEKLLIHNINKKQKQFIDFFRKEISEEFK